MRSDKLNSNSGGYGGLPQGVRVIRDGIAEFLVNADTVSGDKTFTFDSEAEAFIGMGVAGPGIPPGTVISSINTGTAGTDVTSVELSNAATATATNQATFQVGCTHLTNADNGKTILVPALDADHHFVLPEAEDGLYLRFVYVGGAEDAEDWHIKTRSSSNYFVGGLVHDDDDGNLIDIEYSDGNSNDHLNLLTPDAGTSIELWCDGGLWYISGRIVADANDAIAFADHA